MLSTVTALATLSAMLSSEQEFDSDIVATFVRTLRQGDAQVKLLTEESASI